ncbi:MAG TPA: hypothetical protein DDW27_12620 [Bacteroidales bacterium]|nr:hypothetical protein [Bacteroidales bacterium]
MSQIGILECGYLTDVNIEQERAWEDPIKNIDLKANADAARAVLENQQVNMGPLMVKDKKNIINVEWLTDCDATTESCSDDCTIDGADSTPECKEYEITCLRESAFKVADRVYRERTIKNTQSIAFLIERRKKLLDEWIAQYIVTFLQSEAGTNVFTGSPGTVAAALTTIPAANWNDNIWGYFARVALGNQFTNPYAISGDNLFQLVYNRLAEYQNADGKGNVNKMGGLRDRTYFDVFNVEAIAAGYTFLLHKTAAAFMSKSWYPEGAGNAIELMADQKAWSESSRNLPGVVYDVFAQRTCVSNEYYTAFKVQLHGVAALNPTPCSVTNSGILAFSCV